jgi:hypothetical protein
MRRALANTDNQRESTQETRDFYPVVRPSNTCLLPRCGIPMDEGCTQPLSSDPMINLNTTAFFLIVFLLFARNLHNLEPLALTMMITKEAQKQGRGEQHTQESNQQHNHAHKSQIELEVQHTEFATQLELKSLTQRIKCVESESGSLRMFLVSLCTSSMRLGVPFIAPRQLGAVGGQTCLLSGGAPDSPVHHRTVTVVVRCVIFFQIRSIRPLVLGVGWRTGHCPVHTRQSSVPN